MGGSIGTFFTCSLNLERKLHVKAYLYCGLLYKIIHLNIIRDAFRMKYFQGIGLVFFTWNFGLERPVIPLFFTFLLFFYLLLETWNLVHSLGGSIRTFFTFSLNLERKLHVKAYLYCGLLYKIIHLNIIPYNAGRSYDVVNTFF